MAWISRLTRFADMHWVFAQESGISCGIACIIMAAYKVNRLKPGVKHEFTEQDVLNRVHALYGPTGLGPDGLDGGQIVALLNDPMFGMSGWQDYTIPPGSVPQKVVDIVGATDGIGPVTKAVSPAIVNVQWNNGGGHWVLVDTVRRFAGKLYATTCDPWDGDVHVTSMVPGGTFAYEGKWVPGISTVRNYGYSFFGKTQQGKDQYNAANPGNAPNYQGYLIGRP